MQFSDKKSIFDFAKEIRAAEAHNWTMEEKMLSDYEVVSAYLRDYPEFGKYLEGYEPDFGKAWEQGTYSAAQGLRGAAMATIRMMQGQSPKTTSLDYYNKHFANETQGGESFQKPRPSENKISTESWGLFQLNNYYQREKQQQKVWGKFIPVNEMTPEQNIEYASKLKKQEGWKRWSTHGDKTYLAHLGLNNQQIADKYGVDTKYLQYIDKIFGEDSDVAKAVMLAESSGRLDAKETIDIIEDLSTIPAFDEEKKRADRVEDITGANIVRPDVPIDEQPIPDSEKAGKLIEAINEVEDVMHREGDQLPDGSPFAENWDNKLKEMLGVAQIKDDGTTVLDNLDPSRITVPLPASQKLQSLSEDGYFLPIVTSGLNPKMLSYSHLKEANNLARLAMEKTIEEDPELFAWMLYMRDKQASAKWYEPFRGDNWKYSMDLLAQSWPTMAGTLVGVANAVFNPEPYSKAAITTGNMAFMTAVMGGNAFNEHYAKLMDEQVKKGLMTEQEAFNVAYNSFTAVGLINTFLEYLRISSLAKAAGANKHFQKTLSSTMFNKFKNLKITQAVKRGKEQVARGIGAFDDIPILNMGSIGVKQGVGEAIEEWAQGANERFWYEVNVNRKGPGEALMSDVLWNQSSHSEVMAGFWGGFFFGGGISANMRTIANQFEKRSISDEVVKGTDQETDKTTGKIYDEGRKVGTNLSVLAQSDDFIENFSWNSWLKGLIKKAPETLNINKFKYIKKSSDKNHEKFLNIVRTAAHKPPQEKKLGWQILNILRLNPDKMKVLDSFSDKDKDAIMNLARLAIRDRFKHLVHASQSKMPLGQGIEDKIDELIYMYANGHISIAKGKEFGKGLGGSAQVDKMVWNDTIGEGFLKGFMKDLFNVDEKIIKHEFGTIDPRGAEQAITKRATELWGMISPAEGWEEGVETAAVKKATSVEDMFESDLQKKIQAEAERMGVKNPASDTAQQNRAVVIGEVRASDDGIKLLAGKSATELNAIIKDFNLGKSLENDPDIAKTKGGKISFSPANKKVIAKKITDKIGVSKKEDKKPSKTPATKAPTQKPGSRPPITSIDDFKQMASGHAQTVDKKGSPSTETNEDVLDKKKQKTEFDLILEQNDFGGDSELEELGKRAGINKPRSSTLEREFGALSPLSKALLSYLATSGKQNISEEEFVRNILPKLLADSGISVKEIGWYTEKLLKQIDKKYGSLERYLRALTNFQNKIKAGTEEETNFFYEAVKEILKGFASLLANEHTLRRVAIGFFPDPDFAAASEHFQSAWDNFRKGYKNLGWPDSKLFRAFVHGVIKNIRNIKPKYWSQLVRWFKRWASSHELGTAVFKRDLFTKDHDITGTHWKLESGVKSDTKLAAQDIVDNTDIITEEGEHYEPLDTEDDKIASRQIGDAESAVKVAVVMKNLIEENIGKQIKNEDFNDIRWAVYSRGYNTWQKDENGEFIKDPSNEVMTIEEFYDYAESEFNIVTTAGTDIKVYNALNAFYNQLVNQIPRETKLELQLINMWTNPYNQRLEMTPLSDKQLYNISKFDPKTQRERSDFVLSSFLDRQPGMEGRVAVLSKNEVNAAFFRRNLKESDKYDEQDNLNKETLFVRKEAFYLDEMSIHQIDSELSIPRNRIKGIGMPAFIAGVKGGKGVTIVIGVAEAFDVQVARSADMTRTFFMKEAEIKSGEVSANITQEQAEQFIKETGIARAEGIGPATQIVGRYRWWQQVHGNKSMHAETGYTIKEHMKRLSGDMPDGVDIDGAGGFNAMNFDPSMAYAFNTQTGKRIELTDEEGRYIFDGLLPTSSKAMMTVQNVLGRGVNPGQEDSTIGWFKGFFRIMSQDHENYINIKGLNALSDTLEIRDKATDEVIWKAVLRGNSIEIVDKDGNELEMTAGKDEIKMVQGDLGAYNTIYRFEDDEVRILQTAGYYSKGSGASPYQWYEQWTILFEQHPELKPIFDEMMESAFADSQKYFTKLSAMRDNPTVLATYIKSLSNQSTVTRTNLMKMIDMLDEDSFGLLTHPFTSIPLMQMFKNRFVVHGAFKSRVSARRATKGSRGQHADYSHIVPDTTGLVREHEFGTTPLHPIWGDVERAYFETISNRKQKRYKKLGNTQEGRREQVDIINEFLDENETYTKFSEKQGWELIFRTPVQHFTNPQMLRIRRFAYRMYGDIIFMHWNTIKNRIEADFDGDTVTSRRLPDTVKDLIKNLQWGFNPEDASHTRNPKYEAITYKLQLSDFLHPPSSKTPTKGNILKEVSNSFEVGAQVGPIQNARTLRAILLWKEIELRVVDPISRKTFILSPKKGNEEVLMNYAPLRKNLTEEELLNDGDEIVIIEGTKYLKTTSDREFTILIQVAFDEAKEGLMSHWWANSALTRESSRNFITFIRKRLWNVTELDGTESAFFPDTMAPVITAIGKHFKLASLRQGQSSDKRKYSMNNLVLESKSVHRRINSSKLEQEEEILNLPMSSESDETVSLEQRILKKKVKNAKITEVSIGNLVPHFEETLIAMLWKAQLDKGLENKPNLIQYTDNEYANAHNATMQKLSGTDIALLELREKFDLTASDIAVGSAFATKMNQEFDNLLQVGDSIWNMHEMNLTTVKFDFEVAFDLFEDRWIDEFNSLSDGQKTVTTLNFFAGYSTSGLGIVPIETQQAVAQMVTKANTESNTLGYYKTRRLPILINEYNAWVEQMQSLEEELGMKLTEKEEGKPMVSKRGMIAGDFKNENDFRKWKSLKIQLDAASDNIFAMNETIINLEASQSKLRSNISERRVTKSSGEMSRRRLRMKWLPANLLDARFMNHYGPIFAELIKTAPDDKPLSGREIKLVTYDNLITKGLLDKHNC